VDAILACDIGSSSCRVALVSREGTILAQRTAAAPPARIDGPCAEIEPEAWWTTFVALASDVLAAGNARVAGVAICGITRAQVLLDREGRVLGPAMTWADTRAAELAGAVTAGQRHPETALLNGFHPAARLGWLKQHEPERFSRIATVLDPKDYLNARLTGVAASDPVSMARLIAAATMHEGRTLLDVLGVPAGIIPALREPWQGVGRVRPAIDGALAGLSGAPVFAACNDSWIAVVGMGAMRPGAAYSISGTTEVLGVLSGAPAAAEGLIGLDWRGVQHLGGPSQNGTNALSWLARLLAPGTPADAASIERLLEGPRHPQPLIFLPYLKGERVPYWDADLRGAFLGLSDGHGPADLAHAVLEGIAHQNRVVLERAETALGQRIGELRFGGGGAASPHWRQVKADVLGRPVTVAAGAEPGLIGAAILGWYGLGAHPSLIAAQDALCTIAARAEPTPAAQARHDRLHGLFRQAEAALTPISHALCGLARHPGRAGE